MMESAMTETQQKKNTDELKNEITETDKKKLQRKSEEETWTDKTMTEEKLNNEERDSKPPLICLILSYEQSTREQGCNNFKKKRIMNTKH